MSKERDGAEEALLSGEQEDVRPHEAGYLLLGLVLLATVTGLYFWLDAPLVAAAFTYLVVLVLLSLVSNFYSLIALSFICAFCLNYFFAPPIYTLRIDYPQDLTAIAAFLITSFIVNFLVTRVRIEQRDHLRTSESLRDANQRLETTNKALRESEYKLRQSIDTVPGMLWSAGPDGGITQINKWVLDYTGARFEDLLDWTKLLHPDDRSETAGAFSQAIQTGTSHRATHRVRRADGEYHWHHSRAEPLRDGQGRIIQWYGLSVDIDEAKKAEDRLRRSEAYLAEAERLSHTGGWAVNRKGGDRTIVFWSEESYRIFGLDPLQPMPTTDWFWQQVHPDDRRRLREEIQEALRQKRDPAVAFRILLPDGTIKYLESSGYNLFSASGELLEVRGTFVDVTERKRAEQALWESEAKIRRLVDANIIGIFIWDFDGRILEANEAFLDTLGYNQEDLVAGRIRWTDLTPPEWRDRDTRLLQEHKVTGTLRPFEKEYFRKDGSRVPVLIGVATFEESGDQGVAFVLDLTERKRAEEALRESERSSRAAIDGIAGLVAIMAPNGELDALNRQVVDYFGRSLEEMKNWGTSDAVHPEDLPRIAEIFQRSIAAGTPFHYELRLRRFDGEYRWFDNRCVPIREKSGRIVRWYMLGTDIEDRKRAEEALQESETKLRDYAETASDWFWEIGPDYKFTLLTENAFGSHGADRIGTACWDHALDLETEPEKWRLVQTALDSRKPFRDLVYRGLSGNGALMYVRASGKPVFDANGEFRGYRGTGSDVTAIMRAQEALRESERSARSALDGIAGLISILAPDGEVEAANRQFLEYFGSLEWVKNWETNDAVHPEDVPRVAELFKRAIATGIPFQHELRLRRFDGEYRWFENRGVPIRDASGRIARWYVLLTDIEDRKRALAQLEQVQSDFAHMNRVSMMGELTASLSHEITQPIASARNNARAAQNFLDMQPPDLSEVREALSCVVGDTDRAGDIIDRIRDHIKKAPPRKAQFDLNEAIDEVIVLGQSAIIKNRVWVQTRLSEGLFPVHGDRVQLQQVVMNLLLNAVEAMGSVEAKPRDLLISTEQDHADVLVAVRDSGPGLDPSHLERAFDAFYTTKSSGMGMGLSICRSIIEAHGGRLWAEANEPRGAIFKFTLPAVP